VVSEDQPEAREGQAGRLGVAERFVVPLKPGNSGGGKGPQFKTDATRLMTIDPCMERELRDAVGLSRSCVEGS
jgi:hypothetical protein